MLQQLMANGSLQFVRDPKTNRITGVKLPAQRPQMRALPPPSGPVPPSAGQITPNPAQMAPEQPSGPVAPEAAAAATPDRDAMLANALNAVAASHHKLVEHLSKPKKIHRDEHGRVVGVG